MFLNLSSLKFNFLKYFYIFLIFLSGIYLFLFVHFSWFEIKVISDQICNLFIFSAQQKEFFKLTILTNLKNCIPLVPAFFLVYFSIVFWRYVKVYVLSFPSYIHDFLRFYFKSLINKNRFLHFFDLNLLNLCWTVYGFKLFLQSCFGAFIGACFLFRNPEIFYICLIYLFIFSVVYVICFLFYTHFFKVLFFLYFFFILVLVFFINFIFMVLKIIFSL